MCFWQVLMKVRCIGKFSWDWEKKNPKSKWLIKFFPFIPLFHSIWNWKKSEFLQNCQYQCWMSSFIFLWWFLAPLAKGVYSHLPSSQLLVLSLKRENTRMHSQSSLCKEKEIISAYLMGTSSESAKLVILHLSFCYGCQIV